MKQTIPCETNKNLGKQNPKTNQNSLGKYDSWNKSRKTNYRLAINSWIHETNLSNLGKSWNKETYPTEAIQWPMKQTYPANANHDSMKQSYSTY